MNIILDKSLKTDSKQPKVFNLGQIITTLQDLLDNSTIVINGEQTIILSITDENDNILKYLLPLDYKGESFYGLGKNILETDLVSLGSAEKKPYKVYTALLTQEGSNAPTVVVLENSLGLTFTLNRQNTGLYNILSTNVALPLNKTTVDIGPIKSTSNINDAKIAITLTQTGTNTIQINTFMALSSTWNRSDFCLFNNKLEIRVYD